MKEKRYVVVMHTDEGDFLYGKYKDKDKAVDVALEVGRKRRIHTDIKEVWED